MSAAISFWAVGLALLGGGCSAQKQFAATEPTATTRPAQTTSEPGASTSTDEVVAAAKDAVIKKLSTSTQPLLVGPVQGQVTFTAEDLRKLTPDPTAVGLRDVERPKQIRLALQDCIARAAAYNYRAKTEGYGPAISATDIVKAEANFDAVYFLDSGYTKQNEPNASQLVSSDQDTRTLSTGLRKLMPTGAALSTTYNLNRVDTSLAQYITINPSYTSQFMVEWRQPLLRSFGLDVNRAAISVALNTSHIARYKFRQEVREVLALVEKTYWQLCQARSDVVIQQQLIRQTEDTLTQTKAREGFDVYQVQISQVESKLAIRRAEYVQIRNRVQDLEDQLKGLLNDPELPLGQDIEIIPANYPIIGPVVLDSISEVQAALENRAEIHQSKLNIENARINIAVAKNQALPKFDLLFRYTLSGLASNPGRAFDEMSTSHFQDYFVGVSFEYPIGNRAARASLRKADLQRKQAISGLREVIEKVILEVSVAVRALQTAYNQLEPAKKAVEASAENLEAIEKRTTDFSPAFLEVRLNAQETLASARRSLLSALVNYNVALVDLERAKDTLLQYDQVNLLAAVGQVE